MCSEVNVLITAENQDKYGDLFKWIPLGENNAISMTQLAEKCEIDERTLRHWIFEARKDGTVICSSDLGYFFPADSEELISYFRRAEARERSCAISLHSVRKMIRDLQLDLTEVNT